MKVTVRHDVGQVEFVVTVPESEVFISEKFSAHFGELRPSLVLDLLARFAHQVESRRKEKEDAGPR